MQCPLECLGVQCWPVDIAASLSFPAAFSLFCLIVSPSPPVGWGADGALVGNWLLETLLNLMLPLLLAAAMPQTGLPVLRWIGKFSLGAYIFNPYVPTALGYATHGVSPAAMSGIFASSDSWRVGGLVQLVLLFAFPLIFQCTLAPLLHYAITWPFGPLEKALKWLMLRLRLMWNTRIQKPPAEYQLLDDGEDKSQMSQNVV